jgi:predicted alpha/beta-hydrolase family hydrolase
VHHPQAVVLAHGAGTNQDHPSIVALREGLAGHGHAVLTFNYPYTEAGSKAPDRAAKLLACHRAAVEWLRGHHEGLVVCAGRSMGGRMATLLAADGEPMDGLVLYAYPLHPAGKPDKLRVEHLPDIAVPMHFFVGTRDPLSDMALFDTWIRPLSSASVTVIDDADHSFHVPKRSGRFDSDVTTQIVADTSRWMRSTVTG